MMNTCKSGLARERRVTQTGSRASPLPRNLTLMIVLCLGAGAWQVGAAGWIHAKALLAQYLLLRAWEQTVDGQRHVSPWPWADTWPVARVRVPARNVNLIVLAGDSGRTLAFGPGHAPGSAMPGQGGAMVVSGHRDTHFRFLREIEPGDRIEVTTPQGQYLYQVTGTLVFDNRKHRVDLQSGPSRLLLVTCYPFDAIEPGGSMRYLVMADLDTTVKIVKPFTAKM